MARKQTERGLQSASTPAGESPRKRPEARAPVAKPSALLDTRLIYCGDNLDQRR